ncbi:MAG: hypothetical protein CME67_02610 [Halobacteriovoraceae bacterium]|nr:hypothetical protein [Halobacteriovoraceae bacterium]|tara:strand:- start:1382 stop:4480 length:3099 start_codon:yes stop_codon:yes gene_type:complete
MKKYRIRLLDKRVIGPFTAKEIEILLNKRRITGDEDFQEFPTGDWASLSMLPNLEQQLSGNMEDDPTFVRKLSDIGFNSNGVDLKFPKEFEFESDLTSMTPISASDEPKPSDSKSNNDEPEAERTELARLTPATEMSDSDKTIINPATIDFLKKEKEKEAERKKLEEQLKERETENEEKKINYEQDATEIFSLKEFKDNISKEVLNSEQELEEEVFNRIDKEEKKQQKSLKQPENVLVEKSSNKKKPIFIIVAALLLVVILLPEQKETKSNKELVLSYPDIEFPQQYETPDKIKAQTLFKKGMVEYQNGDYKSKLKASKLFKASVENSFKNNPASSWLILVYSELLPHSKNKSYDANRIFKLIQIFNSKSSKDPTLVAGMALFYLNIGKSEAAVKVVEKFNAIESNKPTIELFSVYLKSLLQSGDALKAKSVEKRLKAVQKKSLLVYQNLFDYYKFKNELEQAANIIVEAEAKGHKETGLLLRKAHLFLYNEDFNSLEALLKIISQRRAENSKLYYSKFLEYRALLESSQNKPDRALASFKKALEVNESLELRSRLASLEANSTSEVNILINESKAVKLISDSKAHIAKGNFKYAFKDALEASRLAPNYLPAQLHLASLQIKKSFYNEALISLEKLYDKYPQNSQVVFKLIDAYIEAYKFQKAKKMINIISASDMKSEPEYYSKNAKYYVFKDDFIHAVAWLQKAININPLDDYNTFELAKLFIRYRKYDKAKVLLNKVMDLDPANVEYRVAYGEIVYEQEGANSAIGYLYDVLKDFKDNSKILGAIGIYYYRSGQIKMFETTKEKLLKLPNTDGSLFEFLIKAAKLDQNYEAVVEYSNELLKIRPEDLQTRMFLGQVYMELSKYKEALEQFSLIKSRLKTYPKLQFFMSKLYLLTDNVEKAKELANGEIKGNPGSTHGYVLLGDILRKEGKFNEAEKHYKKAQKIDPKNVDVLVGLAYINFVKSQYEIALDLFIKAKRLDPGRAETYKLLGDVYRKIAQSSLAIESYKMFLELSPNTRYKKDLQNYIRMMQ